MKLSHDEEARLKELLVANGGVITPRLVTEDAMSESSPFHHRYDGFDQEKAAFKHWDSISRTIISSSRGFRVVEKISAIPLVSNILIEDPDKPKGEQGYVTAKSLRVKSKKESAREALRSYLLRAEGSMRKAEEVAMALGLEGEIQSILAEIRKIRGAA